MGWKCLIKLPSGELQKICRDLKEFGDSINISATKDGLKFTVAGDIGTGNVMVEPKDADKDADKVTINCNEPVSAAFALRYLNFFTKATPLSDTVQIQLFADMPLTIEYDLGTQERLPPLLPRPECRRVDLVRETPAHCQVAASDAQLRRFSMQPSALPSAL